MSEMVDITHSREAMRGLLLKGQRKVHWRAESSDRRLKLVDAIADMPIEGLVVVRSLRGSGRVERRRRKCLEALSANSTALDAPALSLSPEDRLTMSAIAK
ncbi:hypothetical protein ABGB17_02365 [Sphaerisporangium sp. B11E5]|uniref:hypothetical protein n=1 Tax=Sphaerisporangium sp. B11E5 TaxID=3153563 RepID=UPI00325F7A6C